MGAWMSIASLKACPIMMPQESCIPGPIPHPNQIYITDVQLGLHSSPITQTKLPSPEVT